jgi:(1->4)-alpha-D-glucan 1-alpha-D-glucosylmutase
MAPAIPTATYRLQFTPDFGFDDAVKIVPYLKDLGITHLYASPFLKARAGSAHGYDIIDHNAINPEIGGHEAFLRLRETLNRYDMGLILDFVPNHMGVHYADNAWWLDVLEWGPKSPYAAFFDIEWETLPGRARGGVLLPILGTSYGEALESGDIELRYNAQEGSFSAWYYEHRMPIGPNRYGEILDKIVMTAEAHKQPAGRQLLELAGRLRGPGNPPRDKAPAFKAEIAAVRGATEIIDRGLKAYCPKSGESGAVLALHHLLERQFYRAAHWRLAGTEINYRRFFDINALAGLRVEDARAFQAIHRLLARLITDGHLQGLRLDHIDGLRDPHQYLRRLQSLIKAALPASARSFYMVVEKILGKGERLPRFGGVAGTTGYEWLNVISHVLLETSGLGTLDQTWCDVSGDSRDLDDILIEAKRRVLGNILEAEFTVLTKLLARIAAGHYSTRDYTADRLRAALACFIVHFPVYRTYITASGPSQEDRKIIQCAIAKARAEWFGSDSDIFDFLHDALTLDLIAPDRAGHSISRVRRFAVKVQQFTGPMMAKSIEDTAFYRFHRLLALNEVGGEPAARGLSIADFHNEMQVRAATWPHGMTATATHDTKRGEDARTRILALSDMADEWAEFVRGWRKLNAGSVTAIDHGNELSSAHEYMLYQALLGSWPLGGIGQDFVERMQAYAVKAAREGKEQTSWLAPNQDYETRLKDYVEQILSASRSADFLASFDAFARRAALIGALSSLAQVALKATMPGVPDFYQGTELWDLSLVDPDNRRPVDFAARATALGAIGDAPDWPALAGKWHDGRIKLALTRRLMAIRRQFPDIFTRGGYQPLEVVGPYRDNIIAFARNSGRDAIVVVTARRFGQLTEQGQSWPSGDAWNDTAVSTGRFSALRPLLVPGPAASGAQLMVPDLFVALPVAILQAEFTKSPGRRNNGVAAATLTAVRRNHTLPSRVMGATRGYGKWRRTWTISKNV